MSSKDHSRTHNEARLKLCIICMEKKKELRKLTAEMIRILKTNSRYSESDPRLPQVICNWCKVKSTKASKGGKFEDIMLRYSDFTLKPIRSLLDKKCDCKLCQLVRNSHTNFDRNLNSTTKESTKQKQIDVNNSETVEVQSNNQLTPKQKDHLLSDLIKSKMDCVNTNRNIQELALSQTHGRPLRIAINSKSEKPVQISAADVAKLQTNYGFSSKVVLGITKDLRVGAKKRKMFEPNLKDKLKTSNHTLDSYFAVQEIETVHLIRNKRTVTKKPFVYCSNIQELRQLVEEKRECDRPHLKFGIDGGGGFLKITLSIQDMEQGTESSSRQRYVDGVAAKRFKDSGVKKIFLIGIIPITQENYENVRMLWFILKINEVHRWTVATDLKLANILLGIMSHASNHPCTWCTAKKGHLNECGEYRTLKDCIKNYFAWQAAGGTKNKAKNFENCVNQPVLERIENDEVIDYIPPPELHLLIGVVNRLYEHMMEEFEEIALKWASACNVQRKIAYGNVAFAGDTSIYKLTFFNYNWSFLL